MPLFRVDWSRSLTSPNEIVTSCGFWHVLLFASKFIGICMILDQKEVVSPVTSLFCCSFTGLCKYFKRDDS